MPIASAHLIMLHAPDVDAYVVARRRTHAAGGTIRRELGMLTKMLRLAYQNAGVSERVAMTITGHKTRSLFDRYHIVSPGDLQEAARRLAGLDSRHSLGHGRADVVDGGAVTP